MVFKQGSGCAYEQHVGNHGYLHLAQTDGRPGAYPSSGEVHHLELVGCEQDMCLDVRDRDDVFTKAFYIIYFDVFARALIEQVLEILIFVGNRAGQRPHSVAKADGGSHSWRTGTRVRKNH